MTFSPSDTERSAHPDKAFQARGNFNLGKAKEYDMKYMMMMAAGLGALVMAGSVQAQDCTSCELYPAVNNVQVQDHATVTAVNNLNVNNAASITASGTAVGNNISVDGSDTSYSTISNNQNFGSYGANVSSALNVQGKTVGGDVNLTNAAIANNAQVTVGTAAVLNNSQTSYYDPQATTQASIGWAGGDLASSTTAVANNLSVTGRIQALNNNQSSTSNPVTATSNITANVGGAVNVSATAIGNNINLKTH